ncbi:cutinase family protein [Gordonia sp. CPCC 206044]|uniref:cutinase family protein n=1 Tax=Gordonia sp. CPCC 206044 TaxID=3140793 RepID=UPI003AF3B6E0
MTLSTAVGAAALGFPAVAQASPVTETLDLFIPGTWETSETADPSVAVGMLKPVADTVARDHGPTSSIYFLPYMARAFDNGQTYGASKATAIDNASKVLRDYATAHPKAKFTITGYSQGADAAGDLAAKIGNGEGPIPAEKVLAVGLLADPSNGGAGETVVGPSAGSGITGARAESMGALTGRVSTISSPEDKYASTDASSNPVLAKIGELLGSDYTGAINAVKQTATAVDAVAQTDWRRVLDRMNKLPATLAAGDMVAAHQIAGSLNNDLRPLVSLADAIDYGTVGKVLSVLPDETGLTKIAAALCEVLDRVDITQTADLVGKIQELAWTLAGGSPADAASAATQMLTIGQQFARLSVNFAAGTTTGSSGAGVVSSDFLGLITQLVNILHTNAINDPAAVINDAITAASSLRSGSHVNYASMIVDNQGTTATDWLGRWLSTSISNA